MSRRLYNLVGNSRIGDLKAGRYDKENHITSNYLRQLNDKVNIHRVKGDLVSAHANKETAFGNLFEYKHEDNNADLSDKHGLSTFMEKDL